MLDGVRYQNMEGENVKVRMKERKTMRRTRKGRKETIQIINACPIDHSYY